MVGTIKWGERKQLSKGERQAIAAAHNVIANAGDAHLLGVAPQGAAADAGLDLVLTADDLLAAWATG